MTEVVNKVVVPPTLDISILLKPTEDSSARQEVLNALRDACTNWGFFEIINHGVPPNDVDQFWDAMVAFFALPPEIKKSASRSKSNARGYFDTELTKQKVDWKEGFDFGHQDTQIDGKSLWPQTDPKFQEVMLSFFDKMVSLSEVLLRAIAETLSLDDTLLKDYFGKNHTSFFRLNHYPPCPNPESELGISPHFDAGLLTILKHDSRVSGLQIYRGTGNGLDRSDPAWVTVPSNPEGFTINIGDMMQVLSNGKYKAPLHRVLANRSEDRYSAPFFFNPPYDTDVTPILGPNEQAVYRAVNWGHFRSQRFAGDYADVGEEIQISHFRVR